MSEATKSKDRWFRDKLLLPLIVVAIPSLVATATPGGWKWVGLKIVAVWRWLTSSVTIPMWLLCAFILFSLLLITALLIIGFISLSTKSPIVKFPESNYTEDIFYNVLWRWGYNSTRGVINLAAFCPNCDMQVRPAQYTGFGPPSVSFVCEGCRASLTEFDKHRYSDVENLILRSIDQRIRAMEKAKLKEPTR